MQTDKFNIQEGQAGERKMHKFSTKVQKSKRKMSRRDSSLAVERDTCTCDSSEGISLSCPIVIQSMVDAGLTREAVGGPPQISKIS